MKVLKFLFAFMAIFISSVTLTFALEMGGVEISPFVPMGSLVAVNLVTGVFNISLPPGILMFNVGHVLFGDSMSNPPGVKTLCYWAFVADIDNFPAIIAAPATASERMSLEAVTGFTFLVGKNFNKLEVILETGEVVSEPIGEIDGQNFLNKATLQVAGTRVEVLALAAELKNSKTVWLIPEHSGLVRVIGTEDFPATVKCNITSGKGKEDLAGMTVEIEAASVDPAYVYAGDISTETAV